MHNPTHSAAKQTRIFYLFSSDHSPRYKRNVLDTLCYPQGHIFRLRYQDTLVSDEIRNWGSQESSITGNLSRVGRKGVTIYAETTPAPPHKRFTFYPTREVEIVRIKVVGSIYYVDVRFGKFINYFSGLAPNADRTQKVQETQRDFQRRVETTICYPLPPLETNGAGQKNGKTWDKAHPEVVVDYNADLQNTTQGYFFTLTQTPVPQSTAQRADGAIEYSLDEPSANLAWESVAHILSESPSMKSSIFYLVTGFYRIRKAHGGFGENEERAIKYVDDGWSTKYPLPMGENLVLKLLFYRSDGAAEIGPQTIVLTAEGDAFAGISQKEVEVLSRYNEERIQIACKRVFDSTLAPITLEHKRNDKTPEEVLAPHPYLLAQVRVPTRTVGWILFGLVVAPILLTLGPDFLKHIGDGQVLQSIAKPFGNWVSRNAGDLSVLAKTMAAIVTLSAGYLGFRRLPMGK
jgi:hypothetical protein